MTIIINGQERHVPEGLTLRGLLDHLGLRPERVAIERNQEVVPRARHGEVVLASGDILEVVTLVGGG